MAGSSGWRRCSACKKDIAFGSVYFVCNVSTCNRPRTGLAFCSAECWEVHLPSAHHRQSWALERRAPASAAEAAGAAERGPGRRRLVRTPGSAAAAPAEEVLIVAARLKEYVRKRSGGFHTSDRVLEPLSEIVRRVCDQAIRNATREGRRTVLDRDIPDA